jgi:hypothetical protein
VDEEKTRRWGNRKATLEWFGRYFMADVRATWLALTWRFRYRQQRGGFEEL